MTRLEFEELQRKFASSGMTLKTFLDSFGVSYSTFNYWSKKVKAETEPMPIAPITLHHEQNPTRQLPTMDVPDVPGVTLAFPNVVRAHFGRGSEGMLMEKSVACRETPLSSGQWREIKRREE